MLSRQILYVHVVRMQITLSWLFTHTHTQPLTAVRNTAIAAQGTSTGMPLLYLGT